MKRRIFLGAMIILLTTSVFSLVSAKKVVGVWRLDGSASVEPRNFRPMTDD